MEQGFCRMVLIVADDTDPAAAAAIGRIADVLRQGELTALFAYSGLSLWLWSGSGPISPTLFNAIRSMMPSPAPSGSAICSKRAAMSARQVLAGMAGPRPTGSRRSVSGRFGSTPLPGRRG